MKILQDLPLSLCQSGPEEAYGVGNYFLQVLGPQSSDHPRSTFYLIDSHGGKPSEVRDPDYEYINQTQIDWFERTSQALRRDREKTNCSDQSHLSLAFWHIPLPEFADPNLAITGGKRREPTEGPSINSHFYNSLVKEGVVAVGCGHDHVNDFCGLLPQSEDDKYDDRKPHPGPWLCYPGIPGFGGYCSYDKTRYHRRLRVWELDFNTGGVKTWKRVEYTAQRVDELVLVENGAVVGPFTKQQS